MDGLALSSAWRFDRFVLDLAVGGLFRVSEAGTREPITIGGRALDVLATLVTRAGELVSKQAIMDAVWPGVAVEEKNLSVQISTLRRVLDQGRDGESCIQTVAGRGYRLAVPAEPIFAAEAPKYSAPASPPTGVIPRRVGARAGLALLLCVLALLLCVLALAFGLFPHVGNLGRPFTPPRLSMAVLPFDGLGIDEQNDRLARALTKDLVTDLARINLLTIVAVPDQNSDPRKAGQDAGVRYVVDGSVRKEGAVLRATARLVAAETGATLWSERFEEPVEGGGDALIVLVRRLGQALNVTLIDTESERGKRERPTNPDATDLFLQARSLGLHTLGQPEWNARIALLERAVQLDPTLLRAQTSLANALIRRYHYAEGNDLERASALLQQAAAINPDDFGLLEANAFLLSEQGQTAAAAAANRRIIEEFPDSISAYADLASCLIYLGRAEDALPLIQMTIRRDPQSNRVWDRYAGMGYASLMLGRDADAIAWTERAIAGNPGAHPFVRANWQIRLAAAHARLGQADLARRSLAEANRIWPYDTVRMHWPDDPESPVYAAQIARWQDALRTAGHRDHADEDADFGVASDAAFRSDVVGFTPTAVPGAKLIRTDELRSLLDDAKPLVIDSLLYSWGRSIPGAIGLKHAGMGAGVDDVNQDRLRREMQKRTHGNFAMPIVAVGFNSERFDGRNLALRLVALGYTNVYWYRGGREAWETAGLPEAKVVAAEW